MRIAICGGFGQLGQSLQGCVTGEVLPLTSQAANLCNPDQMRGVLGEFQPDVVINCAAYNLVDQAEDEPESAFAVNAFGVRHLARICEELSCGLVHVSSDYVFGLDRGDDRPWTEADRPGPVSAYGTSKLTGEYFALSECRRAFVVRTCGLYGNPEGSAKGNFVRTMLRLGNERDRLTIVDDQHCTPTSTADLAAAIAGLIQTREYGLYHATNSGSTTWCGFARRIFELSGIEVDVQPITSAQFGARARRPAYSVLDCARMERVLGRALPSWETAIENYLREIGALAGNRG